MHDPNGRTPACPMYTPGPGAAWCRNGVAYVQYRGVTLGADLALREANAMLERAMRLSREGYWSDEAIRLIHDDAVRLQALAVSAICQRDGLKPVGEAA